MTATTDVRVRRMPAWIWGGGLLTASAVLGVLGTSTPLTGTTSPMPAMLSAVAFAASMVVFALGIRGSGSVVSGRRAGLVALLVLGAAPIVQLVAAPVLDAVGVLPAMPLPSAVGALIGLPAAIVAVVVIGRHGSLPRRWRWAPAWGLGVVALSYGLIAGIVPMFALLGLTGWGALGLGLLLILLGSLLVHGTSVFLGILAIVLGAQRREVAVVYETP